MMKAYEINTYEGSTIVFAETRGKARTVAMHTAIGEDVGFLELDVHRAPQFDSCYRGHHEMDWKDPKDRLTLVKAGWYCSGDFECDSKNCCAKDYCLRYEREEEHRDA